MKASAKTGSIEEAGFELVWDYHEGPAQSFDTRTDYLEQHDERAEKRDIATRR